MTKYDLSFLELDLKELLKKLKKHNTYAKQLEDEIILYAQENARLKEKNEELRALYESERKVKEDYKSKNNKAIEILEKYEVCYRPGELYLKDILLDILKGVDKE